MLIALMLIALVLATLYVDDGFLKPPWLFGSWEPCPLHLAGALDKLPAILLLLSVAVYLGLHLPEVYLAAWRGLFRIAGIKAPNHRRHRGRVSGNQPISDRKQLKKNGSYLE